MQCVPGGSEGKTSACSAGDLGSIPGLGRSPGEGNGNPLQYSCLESPTDGGACVHKVAKSRTRLSDFTFTFIQLQGIKYSAFNTENIIKTNPFIIAGHVKLLEINEKQATLISGELRNISKRYQGKVN